MKEYLYLTIINYSLLLNEFERAFVGFFWGGGVVKYSPWVLVNYQAKYIQIFFLLFFQSLLDEPNPNSPANNVAAQLYKDNVREYEKRVKVIVEDSWIFHGLIEDDWNLIFYCPNNESYESFVIDLYVTKQQAWCKRHLAKSLIIILELICLAW